MSIEIIDLLKPKNGGNFPIVEAIDVWVEGFDNLADAVSHFATDAMIEAITAVLSGKANVSDVNTAVANLQNQINQIEISASAEAVVAPEVAAARVGNDGTSYQTLKARLDAENIAITEDINSRVIPNINLINPDTLTDGYLSSYVGQITESTTYKTTDYIPIANGQSITISPKIRYFLAFNSSKQGIQASYVISEQNNYTYTATTDGYVRFTFNKNTLGSEQAEYGSTVHSYEKYGYTLSDNVYFSDSQITEVTGIATTESTEIVEQEIKQKFPQTVNLVDPDTLTVGYIKDSAGAIETNNAYRTTDFIPVRSGQKITVSHLRVYLAYDSSKTAIGATYALINSTEPQTFTATADGYIRASLYKNEIGVSAQIEYGDEATDYERYGYNLAEDIYFSGNQKNDIINTVQDNYFTDEVNLIDPNSLTAGYLSSWAGEITESTTYYTSDFIPVKNGQSITISPIIRFFLAYNSGKVGIQASYVNTRIDSAYTYTATEDGYIRFTFFQSSINVEQAEYGSSATSYIPYGEKRLATGIRINQEDNEAIEKSVEKYVINGHLLSGKKWYPCGDSFTEGDFTGLEPEDYTFNNGEIYAGKKKVYPYYIGNRTNMKVVNMGVSGMTLAQKSGSTISTCFTYEDGKYTQIPEDAEYITLYFGINDSHGNIPIGTADDDTNETFCGAWNIVFDWIYTNRPNAKVGVIISNGCDTTEYPIATIAMCKKWGIAYLDINGDETLPAVIRTNMRAGLDSDVKQRILEKYRCTATNWHPNAKAHEDESYMIQQFIERL